MKLKKHLAVQYWIDNTSIIYNNTLHISCPIMEAYLAGFEKAKELALKELDGHPDHEARYGEGARISKLGEEEV